MNGEWSTRPERSNVLVIRFIVWFAVTMGRRASRVLLYPISMYFVTFAAQARAASRNYLDRALGRRAGLRDIFRHFLYFSSTILDRVFLLNQQDRLFEIRSHGDELLDESMADGRGVILIGAHMGSFEILHSLSLKQGRPRTIMVMYEDNARKLNSVLKNINPDRNPPVITLGKIDSMLKVHAALDRGEFIGILADRAISGEKLISREFLGGLTEFPSGPFRLAVILECPIILMFGLYQGGNRYNVYLERLTSPPDSLHFDQHASIEHYVQQFAKRLEYHCIESPYNWFNFYDIWK